jgi:hypothetical protein
LEIALQQSDFLPRAFDVAEFEQDLALFESLYPITVALSQLSEFWNFIIEVWNSVNEV